MDAAGILQIAVPFTWLGMVMAISFLEAPLKFRAPGITVPLGLGIGRLVFRALSVAELILGIALTAALILDDRGTLVAAVIMVLLWMILAAQLAALRPRLDRRARLVVSGMSAPRSRLHQAYIALEAIKVVLLTALGVALVAGIPS